MTINSHADLFCSAAYLCLQQESMPVNALARFLEAVAKSIKHATAMSTILATEFFQVRCVAAIGTSKLLLENSSHELRNAPINSTHLFDNKIKEVATANFKAQHQRFLASSSTNTSSSCIKVNGLLWSIITLWWTMNKVIVRLKQGAD